MFLHFNLILRYKVSKFELLNIRTPYLSVKQEIYDSSGLYGRGLLLLHACLIILLFQSAENAPSEKGLIDSLPPYLMQYQVILIPFWTVKL